MINKKQIIILLAILSSTCGIMSQEVLTLEECRQRALESNLGLKQAEMKVKETDALEKAALMEMLPRVTANGAYMWTQKSVKLLNDEQRDRITHMGDEVEGDIRQGLHNELDGYSVGDFQIGEGLADRLGDAIAGTGLAGNLNSVGNDIVNGMETDTRNIGVGMVTLTQPIYVGGKLLSMHRTAALMESLAGVELDKKRAETLVAVDEAYWQVVSVQQKVALAEQYAALLDTLEDHVQQLVEAEMATQGDLAKVRVKRNEAQMSLTKARNGLALSKMLLAERCGMPVNSVFSVQCSMFSDATQSGGSPLNTEHYTLNTVDLDEVYSRRSEMRMLRIADSVAAEGVRMAASTLKPNVVATAGYLVSNPNVFDGFKNEFGGTWMAGVVVNVPIAHPAGIYAVKAAKAKRKEAEYQTEEAKEMIALQVEKLRCELELAYKHLVLSESDVDMAEQNLRLADESFKSGMCSSSDLMAAQTAWMKAKSEVLDAQIEVAMGKVYLRHALGK